jgi:hypothetical protein
VSLTITLSDGETTVALPRDLQWRDEFAWTPVEHSTDYSLTGSLVIQEALRQDGRPITLFGGRDGAWIDRAALLALYELASVPDQVLTLDLWGQEFSVIFRRPAIEAEEIARVANPGAEHRYAITINLMEINP